MRIGVVFPQTELGGDASAVRAYGQRVEELGFTHLLAWDHVVGADPEVHVGWAGPSDTGGYRAALPGLHTTFHEPLVMFGYLAAVTTTLELVTGVIILPRRRDGTAVTGTVMGAVTTERASVPGCPVESLGLMRYVSVASPSATSSSRPSRTSLE